MSEYTLTSIIIYPVKSLGGIKLRSADVLERGLRYDRKWMIVDESNNFLTQRRISSMALIRTSLENDVLKLEHTLRKNSPFHIPVNQYTSEQTEVKIFEDTVPAYFVSTEADKWLSENLGIKCRLVTITDNIKRFVDKKYARNNETLNFADGFPFLLIGRAALDYLNSKMKTKLSADRFRPNFIFTGGNPHDEDNWDEIKIGNVKFKVAKPCARCVITTVDQTTAKRGKEPLLTLSTYRKEGNKIYFGQNLLAENTGSVSTGDKLKILKIKNHTK